MGGEVGRRRELQGLQVGSKECQARLSPREDTQDGSYFHAEYGAGTSSFMAGRTVKYQPDEILEWNKKMTAEILKHSPGCEIVLESLMSYSYKSHTSNASGYWLGFGSYENFDRYN